MNWSETQNAIATHLVALADSVEVLQEACRVQRAPMPDVLSLGDYLLIGPSVGGAPSGWYWPHAVCSVVDWSNLHYRRGGSVVPETAMGLRSGQAAATLCIALLYCDKPLDRYEDFQRRCKALSRECRRRARSVRAPQLALELVA